MWSDLSGREAQPSIDMLICIIVFGIGVVGFAYMKEAEKARETKRGMRACCCVGMFCLLAGLSSNAWTTVTWDDATYEDAMVLSGKRYNAANALNTNEGSATYVGPYKITCRASKTGDGAACHPKTPFGYTPPEPVPKFEAVTDKTWEISDMCLWCCSCFLFSFSSRVFSCPFMKINISP